MKITGAQIQGAVAIAERVLGSPFAQMFLDMARRKLAGELTEEDKASLDGNYAEGLAARADAFERANRP